jgi:hypothetical protein
LKKVFLKKEEKGKAFEKEGSKKFGKLELSKKLRIRKS